MRAVNNERNRNEIRSSTAAEQAYRKEKAYMRTCKYAM